MFECESCACWRENAIERTEGKREREET